MTEISRVAQALFDEFQTDPRLEEFGPGVLERIRNPGPKETLLRDTEATIRDPRSSAEAVARALDVLLDLAKGEL